MEYDAYESAFKRRAEALGIPVSIIWLAGKHNPTPADLPHLDGICFTGGEDVEPHRYGRSDASALCATNPERDAIELALLEQAERRALPLLAICRGAQLLNVFHGGTLIPDLDARNDAHRAPPEKEHEVEIVPGTVLGSLAGLGGTTNSSHHQAVDNLAQAFRLSAMAGDGTIEAFETPTAWQRFVVAVQWHPETMPAGAPLADPILDGLLQAAAAKAKA